MSTMKVVLTIAGSDSSGGAGVQADIKTIAAHHVFAESVITALTAQNTLGVSGVFDVAPDFVAAQIDAVFADIFPDAVKIGMVSSAEIVQVIAERLVAHNARNIVLDPVMVATSGARLISEGAQAALCEQLIPFASVITPNIPEAEELLGGKVSIASKDDAEQAACALAKRFQVNVLVKGGHAVHDANDVLATPTGQMQWFHAQVVDNSNTHGTGCTLSSAIACGLAQEKPLPDAIRDAKAYLTKALSAGLNLGQGSGPLDHLWMLG